MKPSPRPHSFPATTLPGCLPTPLELRGLELLVPKEVSSWSDPPGDMAQQKAHVGPIPSGMGCRIPSSLLSLHGLPRHLQVHMNSRTGAWSKRETLLFFDPGSLDGLALLEGSRNRS